MELELDFVTVGLMCAELRLGWGWGEVDWVFGPDFGPCTPGLIFPAWVSGPSFRP